MSVVFGIETIDVMIAITVVIAAVVAAFAYGIIGGVAKAPDAALVVDNFKLSTDSTNNVTIIHHGGDTITDAFNGTANDKKLMWDNLEVRYNGAKITDKNLYMNGTIYSSGWIDNFKAGDELMITFGKISTGDTLTVVYTPTNSVLQRVKVA